jgi:hypothetical protein
MKKFQDNHKCFQNTNNFKQSSSIQQSLSHILANAFILNRNETALAKIPVPARFLYAIPQDVSFSPPFCRFHQAGHEY